MNLNLNSHYFKSDYITIEKDSLIGLMDKSNKIALNPHYDYINILENGWMIVESNNKYGLLNTLAEKIIHPKYDELHFEDDYFSFQINDKWGCLNKLGEEIIEALYDCCICFENGLACVSIGDKYGVIDKNNKEVIPPNYDWIDQCLTNKHFQFERIAFVLVANCIQQSGIALK